MTRTFWRGVLAAPIIILLALASASAQQNRTPDLSVQHTLMAEAPSPQVGTQQGRVFRWTRVGGDPCNPRVGCTLAFALERSGWPLEVRQALLRMVRDYDGREVNITRGWQGWMTWGSQTPRFHPNTLADFPQSEPALEWAFVHNRTEYVLIRVSRCRNWGGYTRTPTPTQPLQPGFPLVACP
jgi:hypothetical protein